MLKTHVSKVADMASNWIWAISIFRGFTTSLSFKPFRLKNNDILVVYYPNLWPTKRKFFESLFFVFKSFFAFFLFFLTLLSQNKYQGDKEDHKSLVDNQQTSTHFKPLSHKIQFLSLSHYVFNSYPISPIQLSRNNRTKHVFFS